jgi:Glycosyl transferase 4-like domain
MSLSVLMFCPPFCPVVVGAERQAEKLAVALAAAGSHVTVLTPRLDPDSPDKGRVNQVTIERFSLTDLSHRYSVPGVAIFNIPYIVWQIEQAVGPHLKGADVLHCHLASLQTAAAALAGRIVRAPVLCKAATADQRGDLGQIEEAGVSGRLVSWLVRTCIQTWVATTVTVEAANCDALEAAMRDMIEDDGRARRLALKAKERAQRFYSVRPLADRYAHLYESLLAR